MMKMRVRPMEATRTGMANQDSETAREENGTAITTTMRGGRDKDAEDKGWERTTRGRRDNKGKGGTTRGMTMTRGRGRGDARGRDGRDSRDGAYMQEDTHHHGAQGTVPPGQHANDSTARMAHPPP
jgi:hypothetical protein